MSGQYSDIAKRVTTKELKDIFQELTDKIGKFFCGFELVPHLEEKQTHGDIDILVLLHPDQEVRGDCE